MRKIKILTCVPSVLVFCMLFLSDVASPQESLQGAWKEMEESVTSPDTNYTETFTQPKLLMFTERHYSWMGVRGNEPRQRLPNREQRTDADLAAAYRSFGARSGTYEISGSELKTKVILAQSPNLMASEATRTYTYKIDGDTLWLTGKMRDGLSTWVLKLKRL